MSPNCVSPGVECPEMNELPYGRVYGRMMTYGNRIGFRCDYGYTLVGSEQRLCLSDGTWSGTDPTCVRGYFSRESQLLVLTLLLSLNFTSLS